MPAVSESVRYALKSNSAFWDYLKRGNGLWRVAIALALGILLIALGSLVGISSEEVTGLEDELSAICSATDGVGEARVMISYGEEGEVYAVAVLCEGAENPQVRARIVKLVGSLYGIGANRITVLKIKQ